jgi:hypothetical protein
MPCYSNDDKKIKVEKLIAVTIAVIVVAVCVAVGYIVYDAMTSQFPLDPSIKMWIAIVKVLTYFLLNLSLA